MGDDRPLNKPAEMGHTGPNFVAYARFFVCVCVSLAVGRRLRGACNFNPLTGREDSRRVISYAMYISLFPTCLPRLNWIEINYVEIKYVILIRS